jgi:putative FmdB family regulatory protein
MVVCLTLFEVVTILPPYTIFARSKTMPIYEFKCLECGEIFEKLFMSSDEKADLSCPKCSAYTLEKVASATNYAFGVGAGGNQPQISTKSCGSGNQCMTLDLPGHSK